MVEHPAARALTGYLLVRGGVHQVAYARAIENLTGADLTKMFPTPRIPTAKIPECKPHIERGDHLRSTGSRPTTTRRWPPSSTGRTRRRARSSSSSTRPPRALPPRDLPSQPAVFAPDYAPEEIAEIAQKLRQQAGLPDTPLGEVASSGSGGNGLVDKVKNKVT